MRMIYYIFIFLSKYKHRTVQYIYIYIKHKNLHCNEKVQILKCFSSFESRSQAQECFQSNITIECTINTKQRNLLNLDFGEVLTFSYRTAKLIIGPSPLESITDKRFNTHRDYRFRSNIIIE